MTDCTNVQSQHREREAGAELDAGHGRYLSYYKNNDKLLSYNPHHFLPTLDQPIRGNKLLLVI